MNQNRIIEKKRQKLFGTDGIRGCANTYPMDPNTVLKIGQAVGFYFKKTYKNPKILIGKDTRRSGYLLEQALSAGLCSVGADTFLLGPLPTPGIAYLTRGLRVSCGIVLSASHNPFSDNGIKIFSASGYKIDDESEQEIEDLLFSGQIKNLSITGKDLGVCRRIDDAMGQYAVFLKEQFPKHLSLEGVRIVVDCAHGASYKLAPKVFEELGAEVFVIGNDPNGVNINEGCGALHPSVLSEKVKLYKANIGIALDGDADRLIVVDDDGEVLDGDDILAICAVFSKERGELAENSLVTTIMSNKGLELSMAKQGIKVFRTNVGDRNVVKVMREKGLSLGGEQSGHIVWGDRATTGDGVLAALFVLRVMIETQKPLSLIKKVLEKVPQVQDSFYVSCKVPVEEMPLVEQKIKQIEEKLEPKGRVLFRYSGTEAKARLMLEGENKAHLVCYTQELTELIKKNILKHTNKKQKAKQLSN